MRRHEQKTALRASHEGRLSGVWRRALAPLAVIGVVYGDIGTSPLYALTECLGGTTDARIVREDVLGVLSLVVWTLVVVVTLKYLAYLMRADNHGEGGILALVALMATGTQRSPRWLVLLGLFGAALLYGDGVLTPAISVLSAAEGLGVAIPALGGWSVPLTLVVLAGLFAAQRFGSAGVGVVFGPLTLVWFALLAALGAPWIVSDPQILSALWPHHALRFFVDHGVAGLSVLGGVFLVVTGSEALYADMGHFGARPIRLAWLALVMPCLVIDYLGQGAMILADPGAVHAPLVHMAPSWARIPVMLLAALATVIASQAIITGCFSLTRQAMMMGYAPRLTVLHTSEHEAGQVYIPLVNWLLAAGTMGVVVAFGSAARLAAAYGMAVSTTMAITTILAHRVARVRWGWGRLRAGVLTGVFLVVDLAFVAANGVKIADGGIFPLLIGALVFTVLSTWRRGRQVLAAKIAERSVPLAELPAWIDAHQPLRTGGVGVYLTAHSDATPLSLITNATLNGALHERVVLLCVAFEERPHVSVRERVHVEELAPGITRVLGRYGYLESPDVPHLLELVVEDGLQIDPSKVTYILGRETLLPLDRSGMARWRARLFAWMSRNAQRAAVFFGVPPGQVLEVGAELRF